jgi:hypothetical protein
MNSIIEAQQEFTNFFGESVTFRHLHEGVELPHFSNQLVELEQFIDAHRGPAPIALALESNVTPIGKHFKVV